MSRRRRVFLLLVGLCAAFSLILTGLHARFPSIPGWDEWFVAAGLREGAQPAGYTPGFLFVDVGQGDCTLALGSDSAVLIDAGPGDALHRVIEALDAQGVERLDAMILTHPHEDHIGGAAGVMEYFPVGAVYLPEGDPLEEADSSSLNALLQTAIDQSVGVVRLAQSMELAFGDLALSVYLPPESSGDENENGLVVRAALPALSALITGDAGTDTEFALMERGDRLDSDILKVGHHGSKYSTSPAFLRRVAPKAAVISVGRNSYGHPSETVTSRLTAEGIPYYRTDVNGSLFFDENTLLSSAAYSSAA